MATTNVPQGTPIPFTVSMPTNKWLPVVFPVLMSTVCNRNNYPGMTDAGQAHLGATYPCFVEGEKLWMAIQLSDMVGYKGTVGYWDLNEALK